MLSNISISNFKSLKDTGNIKIVPITVLCGTNSCGKSSLIESILLLKQTVRNKDLRESLIYNGEYVRLGDFENVVFAHESDKDMSFSFTYAFDDSQQRVFNQLTQFLGYSQRNYTIRKVYLKISYTIGNLVGKAFKKQVIKKLEIDVYDTYKRSYISLIRKGMFYLINCDIPSRRFARFFQKREERKEDIPRIIIENDNSIKLNEISFEGIFPSLIDVSNELRKKVVTSKGINKDNRMEYYVTICDFLQASCNAIISISNKISYIGPLREAPARRYIYDDVVTDIGIRGENAAYLLRNEDFNEMNKQYELMYALPEEELSFDIYEAINKWMEYMGIKGLNVKKDKEIHRVFIKDANTGEIEVNIADVGFGVSQVFPIILEGLRMPKDSLLILEQPEIHLHPKLQMQIADYIIQVAKTQKSFLVETHSDHFINRLVRRIVEDETNTLAKMINIYFVTPTAEGAQFSPIEIDECRGIANWPEGFFDQAANEQEMIILAGLNKRKNRRKNRQK